MLRNMIARFFSFSSVGVRVQLLPHECVFGFFLVLTWARLVVRAGPFSPSSLAFLGCLLTSIGVILWAGRRPTPWRWRVRLLLYPALMGVSFYTIPSAIALLKVPHTDALLVRWEHALLCEKINRMMQSWEQPQFTDAMMLAYVFFFYYLIAGPAYYCIRDWPRFRQCFTGLFTVYGLGFIGYTVWPAGGPHRFLEFTQPLAGGWLTRLAKPILDDFSNRVDAFPSIHVAVSLYLLVFDAWHYRRRFWRLLAPCIALWVSTVYLRYHYLVDVFAGMALAGIGIWVAASYERFNLKTLGITQPVKAASATDGATPGRSLLPELGEGLTANGISAEIKSHLVKPGLSHSSTTKKI
jgi:hypothetical protein